MDPGEPLHAPRDFTRRTRPTGPRLHYCHQCRVLVRSVLEGGLCPQCHEGFVEEDYVDDFVVDIRMLFLRVGELLRQVSEPQRRPVRPEVLTAIKSVTPDSKMLQDMQQSTRCVICCTDFGADEQLAQLPGCGHFFHDACVRQWLSVAETCPICRANLSEEVLGNTPQQASSIRSRSPALIPVPLAPPPSPNSPELPLASATAAAEASGAQVGPNLDSSVKQACQHESIASWPDSCTRCSTTGREVGSSGPSLGETVGQHLQSCITESSGHGEHESHRAQQSIEAANPTNSLSNNLSTNSSSNSDCVECSVSPAEMHVSPPPATSEFGAHSSSCRVAVDGALDDSIRPLKRPRSEASSCDSTAAEAVSEERQPKAQRVLGRSPSESSDPPVRQPALSVHACALVMERNAAGTASLMQLPASHVLQSEPQTEGHSGSSSHALHPGALQASEYPIPRQHEDSDPGCTVA